MQSVDVIVRLYSVIVSLPVHCLGYMFEDVKLLISTGLPSSFLGHPVWTHFASEYTYDELGLGSDLPLSEVIILDEEAGDPEVGYWGECLVYRYMQAQKDAGNIREVFWANQEGEKGSPYDLEVHFEDETGAHIDYIEVKSTKSESKEVFPVSVQQIKFAEEKKENFHIYRVFNAGNPEKVRLIRIHDLNMRLSQKQVKLCMLI